MICPICKYEHDNEGDHHGCPNCEDQPKPKSKAGMMKKVRQRRKDAGLVEFRAWVTPEQRDAIAKALQDIQAAEAYKPVIDYIQKL